MNRQRNRAAQRRSGAKARPVSPPRRPIDVEERLRAGMRLHRAGQTDKALEEYDNALRIDPRRPEALNLKGALLASAGRPEEGLALMRRAIAIAPAYVEGRFNLGSQLLSMGATGEALGHLKEALRIRPDFARAAARLGQGCARLGEAKTAIVAFRRALDLDPSDVGSAASIVQLLCESGEFEEANARLDRTLAENPKSAAERYRLGTELARLGRLEEAVDMLRAATDSQPDFPEALSNLGAALVSLNRSTDALTPLQRAVALAPENADTLNNYGCALMSAGQPLDAVAVFQRLCAIRPGDPATLVNRGNAERSAGLREDAEASYRAVLAGNPEHPEALNNLCIALKMQDRLAEAIAIGQRAVEADARSAHALANLASAIQLQGRTGEVLALLRRAVALDPDNSVVRSNLLMSMAYDGSASPQEILAQHRAWGERAAPVALAAPAALPSRDKTRTLRVGFVSPDFREHAVSRFFQPLLCALDRERIAPICLTNSATVDDMTRRLKSAASDWRSLVGKPPESCAEIVKDLQIDILIDLAGHTAGHRLDLFARKPAPVQITWLGYPNTTGLDSIDYRLTDARADPVGETDRWSAERLLRLPDCFHCYAGDETIPPPRFADRETGGPVLGSFNNTAKLSDRTISLWARLLGELPDATLLLKGHGLADPDSAGYLLSRFEGETPGISERIELAGWTRDVKDHLALYDRIDIALDPTPYNGTTTTCEALWMGAPVVTLAGGAHAGRVGVSLLTAVGLKTSIARTPDDYVRIVKDLAADRDALRDVKSGLRRQMLSSPLCDAEAFARNFECALRDAWRIRCTDR